MLLLPSLPILPGAASPLAAQSGGFQLSSASGLDFKADTKALEMSSARLAKPGRRGAGPGTWWVNHGSTCRDSSNLSRPGKKAAASHPGL